MDISVLRPSDFALRQLKLLLLCVLIGVSIFFLGWAEYLSISILVSIGVGFTIRFSRYWLISHFPDLKLSVQFVGAVLFSLLVWGIGPIFLGVMSNKYGYTYELSDYLGIFFVGTFFILIISFVFYRSEQASRLRRSLDEIELEQAKKEKLLLETQLRLLQSQIEPHFLFNTLANIQALIAIDSKQATKMLTAFTSLLRLSLNRTRTEWLTLGDELRFNKAYLAIQKIRLGDRLNVAYDISDKITDRMLFPPMLLQPLVENAIVHGIEQVAGNGQLSLSLHPVNEKLKICIKNDRNPVTNGTSGNQVGLINVRERLSHLYGAQASLVFDDSDPRVVVVTMEVPINVSTH